eukprot:GHVO01022042.1.p1 GENE.GHVO01022042.1~~GHVO01022042.1.p1  ORF type:complete len:218 (-),score=27.12 GHVO01022042.1:169-822(-)
MAPRNMLEIAPMLHVTDTHYRNFMRLLTRHTILWTEMIVDNSIIHNTDNIPRHLPYGLDEGPVICQLGGYDPQLVGEAAYMLGDKGYQEINLNAGCPSKLVVSRGSFGAALMKDPDRARDIVHAMTRRVQIPVSVKCRVGVDDYDSDEALRNFVEAVSVGGASRVIIHARKAILNGLDTKANRTVPPLQYERAEHVARQFPDLQFSVNGGIRTLEHV